MTLDIVKIYLGSQFSANWHCLRSVVVDPCGNQCFLKDLDCGKIAQMQLLIKNCQKLFGTKTVLEKILRKILF